MVKNERVPERDELNGRVVPRFEVKIVNPERKIILLVRIASDGALASFLNPLPGICER